MKDKTILLTGATGFIGSHLLERLIKEEYNVIILTRPSSHFNKISHIDKNCYSVMRCVEDLQYYLENEGKIDCIIHCATFYKKEDNINYNNETYLSNFIFPQQLLNCITPYRIPFINTSSYFENENDQNINQYALSKKLFRILLFATCNKHKISCIDLILNNVFGPRDNENKIIPYCINKLLRNEKLEMQSSGFEQLNFVPVEKVIDTYMLILTELFYHNINENSYSYRKQYDCRLIDTYNIREIISIIEDILGIKKFKCEYNKDIYEGLKNTIEYYKDKMNENN